MLKLPFKSYFFDEVTFKAINTGFNTDANHLLCYLEYNSTISCSLIFSGMSERSGKFRNLPVKVLASHSNQLYLFIFLPATESVTASSDLDRSRTETISPGLKL